MLRNPFTTRGPYPSTSQTYADVFEVMRYDRASDVLPYAIAYRPKPPHLDPSGPEPYFALLDSEAEFEAFWDALYDFGTEVVLSGHDHIYERFAPQTADGLPDPEGVRQFVVGTGGKNHTEIWGVQPNSELRHSSTYGLLELVLEAGRYGWTFVPEAGQLFTDRGSQNCHG